MPAISLGLKYCHLETQKIEGTHFLQSICVPGTQFQNPKLNTD